MITKRQADLLDDVAAGRSTKDRPATIENELSQAIHDNPASVEAYLLLGSFYRDRGLNLRAAALFRTVLQISPGHPRATAELRTLPFGNIAFVRRR
jgi:lipopolysaccharide biosynthesis regulator YciM